MYGFSKIKSLLEKYKESNTIEAEFKIGEFHGDRFISSVGNEFFKILNYFLNNPDIFEPVIEERITELLNKGVEGIVKQPAMIADAIFDITNDTKIRESYIYNVKEEHQMKEYSSKTRLENVELPDFFTRFSVSEENAINPTTLNLPKNPNTFRLKTRWSFKTISKHALYNFRIDLTKVTGFTIRNGEQKDLFPSFEVELELIGTNYTEEQLKKAIEFMSSLRQNTVETGYYLNSNEMKKIIINYNKLFEQEINKNRQQQNWRFNFTVQLYNIINKAINIKLSVLEEPINLAITDKADGTRQLLFVSREKLLYLLYPPKTISVFDKTPITSISANTLFDGEYVNTFSGPQYLVFDLLVHNGIDYRNLPFEERYSKLKDLFSQPIHTNIKLKEFLLIGDFYNNVNTILDNIPHKGYNNDGLIFNKVKSSYNEPDSIYKWKPPQLLTIDFAIKSTSVPNQFVLLVKKEREWIQFTGSQYYPFSGMINHNSFTLQITDGQIVEMYWDDEKKTFVPMRIRYDRSQPNNLTTVKDIWHDINNPILESTIKGLDLVLMRMYHNKLKYKLLENFCQKGTLIDIGSGKGGDLHKWKKVKLETILAVEPLKEHLEEFRKRLEESNYTKISNDHFKFNNGTLYLLQGLGQEYQKILDIWTQKTGKNTVQCVSIFNALTFFFENETILDNYIKILEKIEQGGYFIGMVMDADLVKNEMITQASLLQELYKAIDNKQWYDLDEKKVSNTRQKYYNTNWRITSNESQTVADYLVILKNAQKQSNTLKTNSWKITRKNNIKEFLLEKWGNQINIDLTDTIVSNQTEYLVDFTILTEKLSNIGFQLFETKIASNEFLPLESNQLSKMYRTFVFQKGQPKTREELRFSDKIIKESLKYGLDYSKLKITTESEYSCLMPYHFKQVADFFDNLDISPGTIIDATANIGCDTLHLAKLYPNANITAVEVDPFTASLLKENVKENKQITIVNNDFLKYINTIEKVDLIYFDPPWGGPDYYKKPILELTLGNKKITDIIKTLLKTHKTDMIVLKAPINAENDINQLHKDFILTKTNVYKPFKTQKGDVSFILYSISTLADEPQKPESELLITEYIPLQVKTWVQLEPTFKLLKPEERDNIELKGNPFVRIGNIDATCYLNAILRGISLTYTHDHNKKVYPLNDSEQQVAKQLVSKHKISIINNIKAKNKHYNPNIVQNCSNWTWLGLWNEYILPTFKTNVLLITGGQFTTDYTTILYNKDNYKYTIILYYNNGVYDTIAQVDGNGNLITKFLKDDITLISLL